MKKGEYAFSVVSVIEPVKYMRISLLVPAWSILR